MLELNLGRNCLKVIIKTYGIKEIFIPYYACNVLYKAIREEKCRVKFYHINEEFLPVQNFNKDDFILYINYFGLFNSNCQKLSKTYPNLIIDNTQSFYSEPYGLASFNSLRKFFDVQNGAYLYMNKNIDTTKFETDNLILPDANFQNNYEQFKNNELKLNNEKIKLISHIVKQKMSKIDFEKDKQRRRTLFLKYAQILDKYNLIKLSELNNSVPYCYPFCTNNENIIKILSKINILRLWENIPSEFPEYKFLNNVGALPLNNESISQQIIDILAASPL